MGISGPKSALAGARRADLPRHHGPPGARAAPPARRADPAAPDELVPHPRGVAGDPRALPRPRGRRAAAGLPAERRAQAARRRPRPRRVARRPRAWSGARQATATSTSHCSDRAARSRCWTRVSVTSSCPTPTTSARPATRASPAWLARERRPLRRGGLRPHASTTARAVTSPCARATGSWCCATARWWPSGEDRYFQDTDRHPWFHANSLWVDLDALAARLAERDGILGLPVIVNRKTVDPTRLDSTPVIQIESAMGGGRRGLRRLPRDRTSTAAGSVRSRRPTSCCSSAPTSSGSPTSPSSSRRSTTPSRSSTWTSPTSWARSSSGSPRACRRSAAARRCASRAT